MEKKIEAWRAWGAINAKLEKTNGSRNTEYHTLCQEYDKIAKPLNWPTFERVGHDGVQKYFENTEVLALSPEKTREIKAIFDQEYGSSGPSTGGIRLYKHGERLPTPAVEPEQQNLDLGKTLRGMIIGEWSGAEAEQRAMGLGTDTLGGYLLPNPLSTKIIDLTRNQSVVLRAGAQTLPMTSSTMKIARVTKDPEGYWRTEHAPLTESEPNFGIITLNAQVVGGMVRLSIEQLEDTPNVGQIVESALASVLALKLDYAALYGIGAGAEPLGLFNTSGISEISMGADGAALTSHDPFSNAATALLTNNADPKVAIYAPRSAGVIDLLKDTTGQPLQPPESFKNLTKLVSNQIPVNQSHGASNDASCAFVGDFENLIIGMRTGITIEATRTGDADAFKSMQILVRAYMRADIAVVRENHFCKITGIIPA